MRIHSLVALMVTAVTLAGCTQPISAPSTSGDGSLLAEGTALVYQDQTTYIRSTTGSMIAGTIVVQNDSTRRVYDFRVNTTAYTVRITPMTTIKQYPPEQDYQTIQAAYGHPFVLYTLDPATVQKLVRTGSATLNGKTVRRTNGTFTYHGQEAFNITAGTTNLTVTASAPYITLRFARGDGQGIAFQQATQQRFSGWNSDQTAGNRSTSTALYIDTPSPQALMSSLSDWTLLEDIRRGDSYDLVATAPLLRRQAQKTAVTQLLRNGPSLGVYLPVPESTPFTIGNRTYDVTETRNAMVRIDGETYLPHNVKEETERFRTTVDDRGDIHIYARIYGTTAIQSTGQVQYTQQDGQLTFHVPVTIAKDAAQRFTQVIQDNYNHSSGQVRLDDEPVRLHVFTRQDRLLSMRIADQAAQTATTDLRFIGTAPDRRTARYRAGLITDSIQATALTTDVTHIQVGTTGTPPSHSGNSGPRVSFTGLSPADGAAVQPTSSEYTFTVEANRDGLVRVFELQNGNEQLVDRITYDSGSGPRTVTMPAPRSWTAGTHRWRLVFAKNGRIFKERTVTFNVSQYEDTGSLTQGEPTIGQTDAPVTMVYWTNYPCRPFCRQFATQTLPKLLDNEVANGTLRIVFKEFPMHDSSMVSAKAAYCAAQQAGSDVQTFLAWHTTVLRADLSKTKSQSGLVSLTKQVSGIDADRLRQCLTDNPDARSEVQEDKRQAQQHRIGGSPGFLLYTDAPSSGVTVLGARSYSHFQQTIADVQG